ncbi:hypothetical protein [Photobacterium alginatilyticum]|uniref:Uncharacterized protein n=1 Tax=Photobacterium alginatilyticum TaxID=1775171 RepID=A0ABW9YRR6_9GAMM|nr:hypothetical protein [Photobacterium alginatilyticum]NBI56252.1 hypothetical protein [Photobacterium alginatilyticum]
MGDNVTRLSTYRKSKSDSKKKQRSSDKYGLADALIQQLHEEADAPTVSASIHRPKFCKKVVTSFSITSIYKSNLKQEFYIATTIFNTQFIQKQIALAND